MQFDPATEGPGRQAGSSFKTFTLAAALSHGYSPERQRVAAARSRWRLGPGSGADAYYNLHGDCHGGTPTLDRGDRDLRQLRVRAHRAVARPRQLRPRRRRHGHRRRRAAMGIDTSKFQPVVSTTLGTNGVHPLEMAQAYSVLANGGVLKRATFITKIVGPTGKVHLRRGQGEPAGARARRERRVDRDRDAEGAGARAEPRPASSATSRIPRRARPAPPTRTSTPGSWATRRSSRRRCGWGIPRTRLPMTNVGGITVFGGKTPARIWARVHASRDRRTCPRSTSRRRTKSCGRRASSSASSAAGSASRRVARTRSYTTPATVGRHADDPKRRRPRSRRRADPRAEKGPPAYATVERYNGPTREVLE